MMKFQLIYRNSAFLLLSAVILLLSVSSCQDDPYLEPTVDGVPVVTPKSKVYITAVQLNTYPPVTPSGDLWDAIDSKVFDTLGLPDIFFNISDPSPDPPIFWSQNSHFKDVSETDTVFFYLLNPYFVDPFGSSLDLNVYDYELPDSTLMETINFTLGEFPDPLNPQKAYPTSITAIQNGYSVTIGLRWED
ncbi:MAG: hypothetical protein IPP71_09150 [Bacteroidetes bacterium]|nr:hypothetical protein [Bacteroidota bacterium]